MIKPIYFNPDPEKGKFNFESPAVFRNLPKTLEPKRYVMTIKKYSPKTSNGANAYYWAVVITYFLQEWGMNPEIKANQVYMHYDILGQELRQVPDELRPGRTRTESTSQMTGSDFWKYINKCGELYHLQYNGVLPPPKSLGYDTTKK